MTSTFCLYAAESTVVLIRVLAGVVFPQIFTQSIVRYSHFVGKLNKSSAVAEMDDHGKAKWAKKWGGGCRAPFHGW